MDSKRAKELLPIITAFAEGKEIEFKKNKDDNWCAIDNPGWTDDPSCYRIKKEPTKRLMTLREVYYIITTPHCVLMHYDVQEPFIPFFNVLADDTFAEDYLMTHLSEYSYGFILPDGSIQDNKWSKFEIYE